MHLFLSSTYLSVFRQRVEISMQCSIVEKTLMQEAKKQTKENLEVQQKRMNERAVFNDKISCHFLCHVIAEFWHII